jgi:hypothetical protein
MQQLLSGCEFARIFIVFRMVGMTTSCTLYDTRAAMGRGTIHYKNKLLQFRLLRAAMTQQLTVPKLLEGISNGFNINANRKRCGRTWTIIECAIYFHDDDLVYTSIALGANINMYSQLHKLYYIIRPRHGNMNPLLPALLAFGIQLNGSRKYRSLMRMCGYDVLEQHMNCTIRMLLEAGYEIDSAIKQIEYVLSKVGGLHRRQLACLMLCHPASNLASVKALPLEAAAVLDAELRYRKCWSAMRVLWLQSCLFILAAE